MNIFGENRVTHIEFQDINPNLYANSDWYTGLEIEIEIGQTLVDVPIDMV